MSLESIIIEQFEEVARDQKKKLAPLTRDLVLLESGLDFLGFAILVARLEDVVGFDPFSAESEIEFPVTLGDFIKFYEDAPK